jgi:tRNA threonylcarbamoyl adenosine modification protein YeaZ
MSDAAMTPYRDAPSYLPPAILALDSGSPTVSVAVARGGETLAERAVEIGRSSQRLLPMIDEALADAGVGPAALAGIVALAGPGSFTGLRVGLATALGLHQALGVPATAVPTLATLAGAAPRGGGDHAPRRVLALVDVLRDEWACQEFAVNGGPPAAQGQAARVGREDLAKRLAREAEEGGQEPVWLVGFGVGALAPSLGGLIAAGRVHLHEPPGLATPAARAATLWPPSWDPKTLTNPLYFRPPAVTLPKRRGV